MKVFALPRTRSDAPPLTRPILGSGMRLVAAFFCFAFSHVAHADRPLWWSGRDVIKSGTGTAAIDYAMANQGQLKNFARAARDEMIAKEMILTGHPIDVMVEAWRSPNSNARDYSPINLGQLKAVAKPFYDRLIELELRSANSYPWGPNVGTSMDYAAANLGQLKSVFAFQIPSYQILPYATGQTAKFWSFAMANSLVTSGILAENTSLIYCNTAIPTVLSANFKSGTKVEFENQRVKNGTLLSEQSLLHGYWHGGSTYAGTSIYVPGDPHYEYDYTLFAANKQVSFHNQVVSSGVLASNLFASYGIGTVVLKAGTRASFGCQRFQSAPNTLDLIAVIVTEGVLAEFQPLNYGVGGTISLGADAVVKFDSGYLSEAVLTAPTPVFYRAGQQLTLPSGQVVRFQGGYYSGEVILQTASDIYYSDNDFVSLPAGTPIRVSGGKMTSCVLPTDTTLKYGAATTDTVIIKGGTEVQFTDYVTGGVLAASPASQAIRYSSSQPAVSFEANTTIEFSNGLITKGTLATTEPPQSLVYGHSIIPNGLSSNSANFEPGSQVVFSGELAKSGTLTATGAPQSLVYGHTIIPNALSPNRANFNPGSHIEFSSNGVASGTLTATGNPQSLFYHSAFSASVAPGSQVEFSSAGLKSGTLAAAPTLHTLVHGYTINYYPFTIDFHYVDLVANSPVEFDNSFVVKGTLGPAEQSLNYGGGTATFAANSPIEFSNNYVSKGTLGSAPQPLSYYGGTATFAANSLIEFVAYDLYYYKLNYVSKGTLGTPALGQQGQPIFYKSGTTISLRANAEVLFQDGYVVSGSLATDTTLAYGPSRNVDLSRGMSVSFATMSPGVTYVASGTARNTQTLDTSATDNQAVDDMSLLTFGGGFLLSVYPPLDADNDQLPDAWEWRQFGGLQQSATTDLDEDLLTDGFEYRYGFNLSNADQNGNGTRDELDDTDNDGLTNLQEQTHGSSPLLKDTDGDSLEDYAEVFTHHTSPSKKDTDGDDLPDNWEIFFYPLDPLSSSGIHGRNGDPDLDGVMNYIEMRVGSNPVNDDLDSDNLSDTWELRYWPSITDQSANGDPDGDLIANAQERTGGTSPIAFDWAVTDSDDDGMMDALERNVFKSLDETLTSDYDGDGITNGQELAAWTALAAELGWNLNSDQDSDTLFLIHELMLGTSPFVADTDGDGVNDFHDQMPLDPQVGSTPPDVAGPPALKLSSPPGAVLVP